MEINIDCATRYDVCAVLLPNNATTIKFPDLKSLNGDPIDVIRNYVSVFDKSKQVVYEIMETDIWPRFQRSHAYHDHIKLMNASTSLISVVAGFGKSVAATKKVVLISSGKDSLV